jgi:hypothetical protein
LPRGDHDETFGAAVLDHVAKDGDVLLAIFRDAILLSGAPPLDGLQAITTFCGTESVFSELIEFYAMAELLMENFVNVERAFAHAIDGAVSAEDLEIEAIAVEGDDMSERFELVDELERVVFEPTAEFIVFVPGDGNGDAERADISPAALDFVGELEGLDVEINFAIE